MNPATGQRLSPQEVNERISELDSQRTMLETELARLTDRSAGLFKWRNWTLIVGFLLTLASKVWLGYV